MLTAPWALTTVGAATVAAAPAHATFRKRRRLDVLSLLDVVMVSPRFADPFRGPRLIYWKEDNGLRRDLARKFVTMRLFDAGSGRELDNRIFDLFHRRQTILGVSGNRCREGSRREGCLPALHR